MEVFVKKLLTLLLLTIVTNASRACDCMIASNARCPDIEYEQMSNPLEPMIFGHHTPSITLEQVSATPRDGVMVGTNSYHRVLHATLDCIDQRVKATKSTIQQLESPSTIFSWLKFLGKHTLMRFGAVDHKNCKAYGEKINGETTEILQDDQWDNHVNALNMLQGTKNRLLKNYNRHSSDFLRYVLSKTQCNDDGSAHTIQDWKGDTKNVIYKNVALPPEIVNNILAFAGNTAQKISVPERDIATCYQWGRIPERKFKHQGSNHRAESVQFSTATGDKNTVQLDEAIGDVIACHDHWHYLWFRNYVRFTPGSEVREVHPPHAQRMYKYATTAWSSYPYCDTITR
jgi:hypothetical protein